MESGTRGLSEHIGKIKDNSTWKQKESRSVQLGYQKETFRLIGCVGLRGKWAQMYYSMYQGVKQYDLENHPWE